MPLCDWMGLENEYWTCLRDFPGGTGYGVCDTWGQACLAARDLGEIINAMANDGVSVNSTGNRALRPLGGANECRDALGRYYYPQAGSSRDTWRMPRKGTYGVAQCYIPDGPAANAASTREKWTADTCDCTPAECGTLDGRPDWSWPTCYIYANDLWGAEHHLDCIGAPSPANGPQPVTLLSNFLHHDNVVHIDREPKWGARCGINLGALCYGYDQRLRDGQINNGYYNSAYNLWNYLRVRSVAATMRAPYSDCAIGGGVSGRVAVQNAALAWLAANLDGYDMRSLSSRRTGPGNQNAYLTRWEKSWNWDSPDLSWFILCPVISSSLFPHARLRNRGTPVAADVLALAARIRVSLALHVIDGNPYWPPTGYSPYGHPYLPEADPELVFQVFPVARAEIEMKLGYLCTWEGGPDIVLPGNWPFDAQRYTRVEGGVDTIVYLDGDHQMVEPPDRVYWRGHLGWLSAPATAKVMDSTAIAGTIDPTELCAEALRHLHTLGIPAHRTYQESRAGDGSLYGAAQTYGGTLNVGFDAPP